MMMLLLSSVVVEALKGGSVPSKKEPRRITSVTTQMSGVGLKTQLQLVRAVRQEKKAPPAPRGKRPKYAKKGEVVEEEFDFRRSGARLFDKPLLVVDGYNAIFGTPALKALPLEDARRALTEQVEMLVTVSQHWDEATVVFDGRDGQRRTGHRDVTVVFTDLGRTADAEIEDIAQRRSYLGDGATVVVSNDGLVQLMADVIGAEVLSIGQFDAEIKGAKLGVQRALQRHHAMTRLHGRTQPARSEEERADASRRRAVKEGLKVLLADLDRRRGRAPSLVDFLTDTLIILREQAGDTDKEGTTTQKTTKVLAFVGSELRRLKEFELSGIVDNLDLQGWLRQQKLLFGLKDLMVDNWWNEPLFRPVLAASCGGPPGEERGARGGNSTTWGVAYP
mmetsp:Transcript_25692/g.83301  ORF Transcript_25692/g.83301 Transcript_25692/m.83301 type:complete len:392 (+) Transcript_25692:1059-2234(+)